MAISLIGHTQSSNERSITGTITLLEEKYGVSFSYASTLLEGLTIQLDVENTELDHAIKIISKATNFDFEEVKENYFLISPKPLKICVTLVDKENNDPIIGAHVIHNGKYFNYASDQDGVVQFGSQLTIKDSIEIHHLGYENKVIRVYELYANPCQTIVLRSGTTTLNELVITNYLGPGINANAKNHSLEIKTSDLSLLPGETDGDILLSLRSLPGITAPNGKAGNLHVRGSTTDQTLILFDNIPIYHKGHYLGTISPYNPQMIEKISVYRSGYGPRLGGRVGGAIELSTYNKIPDSTRYGVGLNSYYGSVFTHIPIVKKKLSISIAYRKSYPTDWNSPKLDAINEMAYQPSDISFIEADANRELQNFDFKFRDLNGKLTYRLKNGLLETSFLEINNVTNSDVFNVGDQSTLLRQIELSNLGINTKWTQFWNAKVNTTLSIMSSKYQHRSGPRTTTSEMDANFFNSVKDLGIFADVEYILNHEKENTLNIGYNLNRHHVTMIRKMPPANIDETGLLHSLYFNNSVILANRLMINAGVRSNYYDITDEFRIEPRLFLNFKTNNMFSLKAAGGLYSQYINQPVFFDFDDSRPENLTWNLSSNDLPVVKSKQVMFGALLHNNDWTIDLELYSKHIENLSTNNPEFNPNTLNIPEYIFGSLNSKGLDFLVKKQWNKLHVWSSYTFSLSEMQFPDLNLIPFKTYYDQPHVFNIAGTMSLNKWKVSMGWNYSAGTPNYLNSTFFPVVGPPSGPPTTPSEVTAQSNDGHFTAQHQLDLSAVYAFQGNRKQWNGTIGLSILNVYDQQNLVEEAVISFGPKSSQEKRYAIGFAPNIMVQFHW